MALGWIAFAAAASVPLGRRGAAASGVAAVAAAPAVPLGRRGAAAFWNLVLLLLQLLLLFPLGAGVVVTS